jgi:hydroxymethylbilane synthase
MEKQMSLTIATRGSTLALWQANHIKTLIEKEHGILVNLKIIKTQGDIFQITPLSNMGGKGVFVKEIEDCLLNCGADLAVHSMKDVPTDVPKGLVIYANPKKEAANDAFLSLKYSCISELPKGAVVGTSSLRRSFQLKRIAPGAVIKNIRGNVDTRIRKLESGEYDAIILAEAGLRRLGLADRIKQSIPPELILPAACQGVLGIETRENDIVTGKYLNFLKDEDAETTVRAERAFLTRMGGGCYAPIACHAVLSGGGVLSVRGYLSDMAGNRVIKMDVQGTREHAAALGEKLASEMLAAGGEVILRDSETLIK